MQSEVDERLELRPFWEERSAGWRGLHDAPVDLGSYNLLSRRAAVARLLADERGGRLLEVGCGKADYAAVAEEVGAGYVGVDFAHGMLRRARERDGELRLALALGERLPFADRSFDLALGVGYLGWVTEPGAALAELARVLRPGGRLVVQSFRRDPFSAWTHRVRRAASEARPTERARSASVLDRQAAAAGLRLVAREHVAFKLFPERLRERVPGLSIRLSELLTRWRPPGAALFATNVVSKYERVDASGAQNPPE
jgi:SAM-dependent methyltransferase